MFTRNEQAFVKGRKERPNMRTYNNSYTTSRKKYRIKSKFRFTVAMIIMIGMLISGLNLILGLNNSFALTKPQFTEVEVCYGDTLWDIANTYKSDDTDTRRAVFEICKANDIEASDLTPGMVISVPQDL